MRAQIIHPGSPDGNVIPPSLEATPFPWDVFQVAAYFRCKPETIRRRCRAKALGYFRNGQEYLFTRNHITGYITTNGGK